MIKKIEIETVVKVLGWVAVAAGGIMTSWASDKATKKQNDENFERYIEAKEKEEA